MKVPGAAKPMESVFLKNCTECYGLVDRKRLRVMIDEAKQVTRQTFMRHCGDSARLMFLGLGYAPHPSMGLTSAGDWHISYYRSSWGNRRCYFFTWSAIEFIFVEAQQAQQKGGPQWVIDAE